MGAGSDKLQSSLAEQLADFDRRLEAKADDISMLAEIQRGIGSLLREDDGNEAVIRRMLQQHYDDGQLRKETFQLVKSMLDRFVTEEIPTSATVPPANSAPVEMMASLPDAATRSADSGGADDDVAFSDDVFSATAVIDPDELPERDGEERVQVGSLLRDRFLLKERVAGGSMGVVYKALDRRLAETGAAEPFVAVKVLSPQLAENAVALRALQQEAAKGRCLTHPNIVRFFDLDRDDDLYFMVMEWLEGRTLADILDAPESKSFAADRAMQVVQDVGRALEYAHRCGIIHADVKPGNVMIMPDGSAKLFDFGIARVRQKSEAADDKFDPGILGAITPAYSSMQVLTGEEPVAADDVFSLACLTYRLIAGYRVFGPRNAAEASQEGMTPQQPPGLDGGQWKALKKALSYSRVTRYPSISEFLDALGLSASESAPTRPVPSSPTGKPVNVRESGPLVARRDPEPSATTTGPIHIGVEVDERPGDFEVEHGGGIFKWVVGLVILVGVGGAAAWQFGYLDPYLEQLRGTPSSAPVDVQPTVAAPPVGGAEEGVVDLPAEPDDPIAAVNEPSDELPADELPADEMPAEDSSVAEPPLEELPLETEARRPEPLPVPVALPPADLELRLPAVDVLAPSFLTLLEDGGPKVVEFTRTTGLNRPARLRIEEIGFSGNRSPLGSLQYSIAEGDLLEFAAGQVSLRRTFQMAPDRMREADQQSTLRIRDADLPDQQLALLDVILEDDDQRLFENSLPANTIAFAASQVSVGESDPAVQIDILRFNPDSQSMSAGFVVRDVTATDGEDYFAPAGNTISFGPGQRSARLLVPLVQDALDEGDEAFIVELSTAGLDGRTDIYYRIAVMIRDDDGQLN